MSILARSGQNLEWRPRREELPSRGILPERCPFTSSVPYFGLVSRLGRLQSKHPVQPDRQPPASARRRHSLAWFSQPCPRSGQLIPVKIDRVRDPKTCLRTNRAAFIHLCEFVRFDPAILEKSCENLPACWTVVKWSAPHLFDLPRKDPCRRKAKVKPSSRHS